MLQTTLHKKIKRLYTVYPELIHDNRLLEYIMLTLWDNLEYVTEHPFHELKYLLSDQRLNLNAYREAPALESITRAARYVREEMGIEPDGRRKKREEEMRYMYSTQARLDL